MPIPGSLHSETRESQFSKVINILVKPFLLIFDFPKESNILIYSELEDFKEKIILLLNDKNLHSFGINGRKFVEENYTWENVANRFLKEFEFFLK